MAEESQAESYLHKVAVEIGAEVREILDRYADEVMDKFYSDYSPKYYERTNNLRNNHKSRNTIWPNKEGYYTDSVSVTFSPEYMSNYVRKEQFIDFLTNDAGVNGFASTFSSVPINLSNEQKRNFDFEVVNPRIIFDLDFIQGYHGGKTWGKTKDWHNRQKAKRMNPSPYELMNKKYDDETKPNGEIGSLVTRNKYYANKIFEAMSADMGIVFDSAFKNGGGK